MYEAKPISLPNEIHAFRSALEKLLEELGITLVVFVDDLDRCLPGTAISTPESIRLLLFLKRTAFVIAADNEFIHGAVKKHFEGTGITSDIATNYFDKLIQVPLHVPRIGVNEAKAYLVLLLLEREARAGIFLPEKFDHAKVDIPRRLARGWLGETITSAFLHDLVGTDTRLQQLMDLAEGLATLMFKSSNISANPRLMKRFLNTVFLRESLAAPQGITLDIPSLAKWHLLERYNEDLAKALSGMVSSEHDGEIRELLDAETIAAQGGDLPTPFSNDPFVIEWLQLAPPLGAQDLRPLLHLSRDTATRDFGDDNMTPASRELRTKPTLSPDFKPKYTCPGTLLILLSKNWRMTSCWSPIAVTPLRSSSQSPMSLCEAPSGTNRRGSGKWYFIRECGCPSVDGAMPALCSRAKLRLPVQSLQAFERRCYWQTFCLSFMSRRKASLGNQIALVSKSDGSADYRFG